jgi:hypothetical protein
MSTFFAAPDSTAYEVLYFWESSRDLDHIETDFRAEKEELEEIRKMVADDAGEQYKATIDLLKRSESRQRFTNKKFRGGL